MNITLIISRKMFASATRRQAWGIVLLILLASGASAQTSHATDSTTPLGLAPGSPAGSYALTGFDNINLYNGNANIVFPLLHIGGRGSAQTAMLTVLDPEDWLMENSYVIVNG